MSKDPALDSDEWVTVTHKKQPRLANQAVGYQVPPLIRQIAPHDIGTPPPHLKGPGLHNYVAERAARLTGKQYLTYGTVFWGQGDYDYNCATFYHTSADRLDSSYFTSGRSSGHYEASTLFQAIKKDIYHSIRKNNWVRVGIYELYNEDPQYVCSDLMCDLPTSLYDCTIAISAIDLVLDSRYTVALLGNHCTLQKSDYAEN